MIAYTLGFVFRGEEVLMLNREKSPWKGAWNGVGGKLQDGESPLECIRRELTEETGIPVSEASFLDKGELTWTDFEAIGNGLRIFFIRLKPDYELVTPIKTKEGILDWKKIDWVVDVKNEGVAKNIPLFLPALLADEAKQHIHCIFEHGRLISVHLRPWEVTTS
jgi:8-oxo-dGTP diphosphatase